METDSLEKTSSQRGGRREGAGRKKVEDRSSMISFGVSARAKENLKRYAEERGVSLREAATAIFESMY